MGGLGLQSVIWFIFELIFSPVAYLFHKFLTLTVGTKKAKIPPIEVNFLKESAISLAEKIRNKQITSQEVVKACIERIADVNPLLNAVVDERFNEALEEAKAADEYVINSGKTADEIGAEKPLLGVPFSSKNAIGMKGLIMNAGVVIKRNDKAKEDSEAVALLRKAGAIPLCITNVPELCVWTDSSCILYGKTNNPYDLTKIPGGSSGGEGALVTTGATVFGVGNDIGGSVRIPAYSCGIFGLKPTIRIISNRGQFPSSYMTEKDNYNCTGPMVRYAKDLLPLLKILAGNNASRLKLSDKIDLSKVNVFYTEDYGQGGFFCRVNPELKDSVLKVVSHLEKVTGNKSRKIKLPVPLSQFTAITYSKIVTAKAPSMIELITGKEESKFNIPLEFLKWCLRLSNHTLHLLYFLAGVKYTTITTPEVVKRSDEMIERLDQMFKKTLGDNGVFIFPPQPSLPYYHEEQLFKFHNICYTSIYNILGYPSTACPIGIGKEGLPLGVQVIATKYNDKLTIAVAEEIEKGFGGWVHPDTSDK